MESARYRYQEEKAIVKMKQKTSKKLGEIRYHRHPWRLIFVYRKYIFCTIFLWHLVAKPVYFLVWMRT